MCCCALVGGALDMTDEMSLQPIQSSLLSSYYTYCSKPLNHQMRFSCWFSIAKSFKVHHCTYFLKALSGNFSRSVLKIYKLWYTFSPKIYWEQKYDLLLTPFWSDAHPRQNTYKAKRLEGPRYVYFFHKPTPLLRLSLNKQITRFSL